MRISRFETSSGNRCASFGRFTVDEHASTFTFRVEGALARTLVTQDRVRRYELSGKRIVMTPASPNEHWRVTWVRD